MHNLILTGFYRWEIQPARYLSVPRGIARRKLEAENVIAGDITYPANRFRLKAFCVGAQNPIGPSTGAANLFSTVRSV
jgi:hypothetical protein